MTQEDKELLLKDLCARLPYGTVYAGIIWEDGISRSGRLDLSLIEKTLM